jgi:beta-glucanase (GH16 family)
LAPSASLSSPAAGSLCSGGPAAVQGSCPSAGPSKVGNAPAGPAPAGASPPFAAAAGRRWSLNFDEEFNGSDYNHSRLTPCFDWNDGDCTASFNHGRERYLPSQVTVSNGTAKLTAGPAATPYPSSACENGSCTYNSGMLSTARPRADNGSDYLYKFTYGYVESSFKFPATQGFFTAFWMLPADPSFNYRSEIDILELLGNDPTTMFMTYNYDNRTQSYPVNNSKFNNGACPVKDYSKEFVRMGVDWEPNRIAWYIDGIKCGEFTNASQIENGPMQLILNMMVDNDWQRQWNVGLADPTLTRQLQVDYIRVYQQVPA